MWCHVVGSPRKSTVIMGFSHKSMGSRAVGLAGQLKICTLSCGAWLHEGQLSEVPDIILALYLFSVFDHPDLS